MMGVGAIAYPLGARQGLAVSWSGMEPLQTVVP